MSSDSSTQFDIETLSPLSDAPNNRIITNNFPDGYISSPSMSKSETQDSLQWKFGSNIKGPIDFSPKKIVSNLFPHPEEDIQTNYSNQGNNLSYNSNPNLLFSNIPNDRFRAAMRSVESKILQDNTIIISSGLLDMAIHANSFEYYQKVKIELIKLIIIYLLFRVLQVNFFNN